MGSHHPGAGVDQADEEGTTPLFMATQNGHEEVVCRLLESHAAVNQAMRSLGLAPDLQLRIITYFTYERLHRSHIGFNALFSGETGA